MIQWKTLSLGDKSYIDGILKSYPLPLSDYNFTNFWTWNSSYHFKHAWVEGFLCMKMIDYFLYPVGHGSRQEVIALLAQDEPHYQMRAIPEEALDDLPGFNLTAEEERFDYLYTFEDLLYLHGNRYQAKRNLIHQFERNYNFEYRPIDVTLIPNLIDMQQTWFEQHRDGDWLAKEHQAALSCLKYFPELNVEGGALLVDGKIIAYSIAEHRDDTLQIHFEKAFPTFKGAYQMMSQQLLKHLQRTTYVNREETLGFPNLEKAKESYHPLKLIKKFKMPMKLFN